MIRPYFTNSGSGNPKNATRRALLDPSTFKMTSKGHKNGKWDSGWFWVTLGRGFRKTSLKVPHVTPWPSKLPLNATNKKKWDDLMIPSNYTIQYRTYRDTIQNRLYDTHKDLIGFYFCFVPCRVIFYPRGKSGSLSHSHKFSFYNLWVFTLIEIHHRKERKILVGNIWTWDRAISPVGWI